MCRRPGARNVVERLFSEGKRCWRVVTRCNKLAANQFGMIRSVETPEGPGQ
jgi:hypothetical protein